MFRKRLLFSLLALGLLLAPRGFAHPMGNFSVNHYSKISFEKDGVRVTYIIDLAEIPTYQELQQGNVTANVADPAVMHFVESRGVELGRGLSLMVGGTHLPLHLVSSQVIFPPGAGGLPTMKMGFVYQAPYPPDHGSASLQYSDNNFPGHAGWKEIVAIAQPGASFISSSVPQTDRSAELSNYPTDLLNSPPQDLSAAIQFRYPIAIESPRQLDRPGVPWTACQACREAAVEGPAVFAHAPKPARSRIKNHVPADLVTTHSVTSPAQAGLLRRCACRLISKQPRAARSLS